MASKVRNLPLDSVLYFEIAGPRLIPRLGHSS